MRLELKSIEKSLNSLVESLTPVEKPSSKEEKQLGALKREAKGGGCTPLDNVHKKHGAKKAA